MTTESWKKIYMYVIPLSFGLTEVLLKLSWGDSNPFSSIGITLSSISIGIILPFASIDSVLISKLINFSPNTNSGSIIFEYRPEFQEDHDIRTAKYSTYLFVLALIFLFAFTIYFSCKEDYKIFSNITGFISLLFSSYYLGKI